MKRLVKFEKTRVKAKTFLVTVRNEYDKKLMMPKNVENRENITTESIYCLPTLTKAHVFKENQVLKKRRELLEEGFPREKQKKRNFELFNVCKEVQIKGIAPSPENRVHHE